eukprot:NODE_2437_length_475_cov_4.340376_g2004_i0.p1 GENE.NODE_2437_length_475_cov_4.340376_g2004_i0~~NODE_2437_length_475_cov_4.340376_g2004_i0.p1  ORF type:complete len:53 (+),score=0.71 NODE_2437_length_475_cov_4.340376_g2004_i0:173-331(+)
MFRYPFQRKTAPQARNFAKMGQKSWFSGAASFFKKIDTTKYKRPLSEMLFQI